VQWREVDLDAYLVGTWLKVEVVSDGKDYSDAAARW